MITNDYKVDPVDDRLPRAGAALQPLGATEATKRPWMEDGGCHERR